MWGGFTAPIWVKEINGAPITVTGQNAVDPGSYAPQTIGRFWTADYINAWQNLQNALATKYDGMAIIRGISQTAGAYATDEPFVPLQTNAAVSSNPADGTVNQIAQLQMGGFNDAGEMLTLRAAIADYYQWSTTPLDYTFNEFHLFDSGNELADGNFTLAVLQQARNSARIVQAGNHAIRNPQYAPDDVVYGQLAQDATVKPGAVVNSFQTAAPIILVDYAGWQGAIANGVLWNGGNIELWDFPTPPAQPNGFLSFSPQQVQGLAAILSAGSPPPNTGAPDDGSALSWIAPGSVTGAPGRIAFTGTDAILLASANPGRVLRRLAHFAVRRHARHRRPHRPLRRDQRHDAELRRLAVDGEHAARERHRHLGRRHRYRAHRGDRQRRQLRRTGCRRADRDPGRASCRDAGTAGGRPDLRLCRRQRARGGPGPGRHLRCRGPARQQRHPAGGRRAEPVLAQRRSRRSMATLP